MRITRLVRYSVFALLLALSASAFAGVLIQVGFAPPVLPVYTQPACPGDGYIWTPGYWAYGPEGYYWVPGTWVVAPEPGLLWTPGYWGWGGGFYVWHAGYWGPHVGFYGGVNYGFGYTGVGFFGGYWEGGHYFYNRSVTNINITNVHVYNRTVINNVTVNRVSYNGGRGGINVRPSREQERAEHEHHFEATRMQMDHEHGARENREFLASVNHGRPAIAATARPAEFRGRDVVPARGGERSMNNRDMDRNVPRPQNNARNMDRPNMDRSNGNRGNIGRQDAGRQNAGRQNMDRPMPRDDRGMNARNAPRPDNRMENRGGPAPRPAAHSENARGHENAPKPEKEERGRK
jgi:hypothetical protein